MRIVRVVPGSGVAPRGPSDSRIDLAADHDGVLRVRVPLLERVDRLDAIEVFTRLDGQVVSAGTTSRASRSHRPSFQRLLTIQTSGW